MDSNGIASLPRHVAIIMDGNGRWAKARGLSRSAGHRAGTERLRGIIRTSSDLGIEVLSIFAFSTENWQRPQAEVDVLMGLLREFFSKEIDELDQNGVRIRILGCLSDVSQGEIARAARLLAEDVQRGVLTAAEVDEAALMRRLYTHDQPEVDFLIRTSGEERLSNFLLLQSAYAELYFTDTYWPDFSDEAYREALRDYASRDRRYGRVK